MRHTFTIAEAEHAVWLSRRGEQYALHVGERTVLVALEHFPEKACPGLDPGWTPVFRKEMRQTSNPERFPPTAESALAPAAAGHQLTVDGETAKILLAADGDVTWVHVDGASYAVRYTDPVRRHAGHAGGGADDVALAPMPGVAIAVHVAAGDDVVPGATLMVIESMKLETAIKAWRAGTVAEVHVAPGQTFDRGAALVTLTAEAG
jgi:3-methylcrotonyl-CoA carboxylase alpha subunit